jgi:hypothetical protein
VLSKLVVKNWPAFFSFECQSEGRASYFSICTFVSLFGCPIRRGDGQQVGSRKNQPDKEENFNFGREKF